MAKRIKIWEGVSNGNQNSLNLVFSTALNTETNMTDPPYQVGAYKSFEIRGYLDNFAEVNDIVKLQWCWAMEVDGQPFWISPDGVGSLAVEQLDPELVVYVQADSADVTKKMSFSLRIPEVRASHGYLKFVGYKRGSSGSSATIQVGGFIYLIPKSIN